jgi:hypothetical protein
MNAADSNAHAAPSPYDSVRLSEPELQEFLSDYRQLLAAVRLAAASEKLSPVRVMHRALDALDIIVTSIVKHPHTGQSRRLVKFIAGCYDGRDYPFNLTELRGLDTTLATACLEYLDYDRLAIREIHHFLPQKERTLLGWLKDYDLGAVPR